MHPHHQAFLDAIANKRRLSVRYFDKKEQREMVRTCAALDYGPLRGATDGLDYYQLWDLEGKKRPFNITALAENIVEMLPLDATFEPVDIIQWAFKPGSWSIARDWGEFS